ncbi:MAG: ring-cleaving dioxygenase [Chloroflexota bacterium]|nr:ring-cleaving dioxygenase [Chloroflexota bacterium]
MNPAVHGIHHVTAIAGDAQENLNFYVGVLGLRLVKKSVNQDDPGTYHLFYADGAGSPGTDLTFFPWPGLQSARLGAGMPVEVSFAVPRGSLDYWQQRLERFDVEGAPVEHRFGERTLPFTDPHGLRLAIVEIDEERDFVPWENSPVPLDHQLRGMHSTRLWENRLAQPEALLTEYLGFTPIDVEDGWHRYGADGGESGKLVEVKELPSERRGRGGTGGIHHVAWRVHDSEEQMALQRKIQSVGLQPTPQIDRFWFKSVYFREPGGVLFELATDGPGFDRDEDPARLGELLILPPWLEGQRPQIEGALPTLELPPLQQ